MAAMPSYGSGLWGMVPVKIPDVTAASGVPGPMARHGLVAAVADKQPTVIPSGMAAMQPRNPPAFFVMHQPPTKPGFSCLGFGSIYTLDSLLWATARPAPARQPVLGGGT